MKTPNTPNPRPNPVPLPLLLKYLFQSFQKFPSDKSLLENLFSQVIWSKDHTLKLLYDQMVISLNSSAV